MNAQNGLLRSKCQSLNAIYTLSRARAVFSGVIITVSTCSYIAHIGYTRWTTGSLLPDVIDGEADGRNEEILHPVEAMASWFGVNGVMGHALTGLADHLKHRRVTHSTGT